MGQWDAIGKREIISPVFPRLQGKTDGRSTGEEGDFRLLEFQMSVSHWKLEVSIMDTEHCPGTRISCTKSNYIEYE
jgi:hypothetical protein